MTYLGIILDQKLNWSLHIKTSLTVSKVPVKSNWCVSPYHLDLYLLCREHL